MDLKNNWWKFLTVVIMLYVIIAGLLIPLKPGILSNSNLEASVGKKYHTDVQCYNCRLNNAEDLNVWLWLPSDRLLKAEEVVVVNDTYLSASFDTIPSDLEFARDNRVLASVMIDNSLEGHYFYRNAVSIFPPDEDYKKEGTFYSLSDIKTVKSIAFPFQHILYETSRNTYFHVAIWMAMFGLLILSCVYSGKYLLKKNIHDDYKASAITTVAIVFGIAGILTGSMWAKFTWGAFWTDDVKLNMTAVALLIYLAYWVLRSSVSDPDVRARLASVFNIFAFASLIVLVMVIPRLTDSLHPGNGGNPAFSSYDMDSTMRMVFYPAIIGYFLIGLWMAQLYFRYLKLRESLFE